MQASLQRVADKDAKEHYFKKIKETDVQIQSVFVWSQWTTTPHTSLYHRSQ